LVKCNKRAAQQVGLDALENFTDRCEVVLLINLGTNMRLEDGLPLLGCSGQRLAADRWLRNIWRSARYRRFHASCAFSCWTAASRCLEASPSAATRSSAALILRDGPRFSFESISQRLRSSLHCRQALTQFSIVVGPPRPRGMRWSTVAWSGATL
jgi:hypothetical protein